jgi:hypothetical protein
MNETLKIVLGWAAALLVIGSLIAWHYAAEHYDAQQKVAEQAEQANKNNQDGDNAEAAIERFAGDQYPGWIFVGDDGERSELFSYAIEPLTPVHVHLTKGKETQLISIVVAKFYKPDKTAYWQAFKQPAELQDTDTPTAKSKIAGVDRTE